MNRLFWKLFAALWLSVMAFAVVGTLVQDSVARRHLGDPPALLHGERVMGRLQVRLAGALERGGVAGLRAELAGLPRFVRRHVFVIKPGGGELLGREATLRGLRRRGTPLEERALAGPPADGYQLLVASPRAGEALLAPGRRGIVLRLVVAAGISALISALVAAWLTRPMRDLRAFSQRIADGDLAARVEPALAGRGDEFGELARDFDTMADRLQASEAANQRLLRDVSHELRSPLARLSVALGLARQRGDDGLAAEFDRIELESQRLESLVGDILGLLRETTPGQPLARESFDLAELLADLAETVSYEAGDNARGVIVEAPGKAWLVGDRELLWRALENVLRNALAWTDPARGVDVSLAAEGSEWRLRVRDHGPGVPEADLPHLFEPFYRVEVARERGRGGHGLGLAIAESAIRRHDGTIRVSNAGSGGLEIIIRIPRPNSGSEQKYSGSEQKF